MLYHFYVKDTIYDVEAKDAGSAMQFVNRNIIDKLDLHPMAWENMPKMENSFFMKSGDFFS